MSSWKGPSECGLRIRGGILRDFWSPKPRIAKSYKNQDLISEELSEIIKCTSPTLPTSQKKLYISILNQKSRRTLRDCPDSAVKSEAVSMIRRDQKQKNKDATLYDSR